MSSPVFIAIGGVLIFLGLQNQLGMFPQQNPLFTIVIGGLIMLYGDRVWMKFRRLINA